MAFGGPGTKRGSANEPKKTPAPKTVGRVVRPIAPPSSGRIAPMPTDPDKVEKAKPAPVFKGIGGHTVKSTSDPLNPAYKAPKTRSGELAPNFFSEKQPTMKLGEDQRDFELRKARWEANKFARLFEAEQEATKGIKAEQKFQNIDRKEKFFQEKAQRLRTSTVVNPIYSRLSPTQKRLNAMLPEDDPRKIREAIPREGAYREPLRTEDFSAEEKKEIAQLNQIVASRERARKRGEGFVMPSLTEFQQERLQQIEQYQKSQRDIESLEDAEIKAEDDLRDLEKELGIMVGAEEGERIEINDDGTISVFRGDMEIDPVKRAENRARREMNREMEDAMDDHQEVLNSIRRRYRAAGTGEVSKQGKDLIAKEKREFKKKLDQFKENEEERIQNLIIQEKSRQKTVERNVEKMMSPEESLNQKKQAALLNRINKKINESRDAFGNPTIDFLEAYDLVEKERKDMGSALKPFETFQKKIASGEVNDDFSNASMVAFKITKDTGEIKKILSNTAGMTADMVEDQMFKLAKYRNPAITIEQWKEKESKKATMQEFLDVINGDQQDLIEIGELLDTANLTDRKSLVNAALNSDNVSEEVKEYLRDVKSFIDREEEQEEDELVDFFMQRGVYSSEGEFRDVSEEDIALGKLQVGYDQVNERPVYRSLTQGQQRKMLEKIREKNFAEIAKQDSTLPRDRDTMDKVHEGTNIMASLPPAQRPGFVEKVEAKIPVLGAWMRNVMNFYSDVDRSLGGVLPGNAEVFQENAKVKEVQRPRNTGNIANDLNNPGNLTRGGVGDQFASGFTTITPTDGNEREFLVFDSPEAGRKAMIADIAAKQDGRSSFTDGSETLNEFIDVWAGQNTSQGYRETVARESGYDLGTNIRLIPTTALADAVQKAEGFSGTQAEPNTAFAEQPQSGDDLLDEFPQFRDQIKTARGQGYSDDEIREFLKNR